MPVRIVRTIAVAAALLATAAGARQRADLERVPSGTALRLQQVLEDGSVVSGSRTAYYDRYRRLGMARAAAATADSQQTAPFGAGFVDAGWRAKLAQILRRQTGAPVDDPEAQLQRYLEDPPAQSLRARARTLGLPAAGLDVYIQVFKRQTRLEVHARRRGGTDPYLFLKGFAITASPFTYPDSSAWRHAASPLGLAGPKTRRGDGRVPEGCYRLVHANRWSRFHLSFAVSYPNGADLARRSRWGVRAPTGGSIALHGGEESAGCIAVGDEAIEEIFLFLEASGAEDGVYARIDIFPGRFDSGDGALAYYERHRRELTPLWASLRAIQEQFAKTRQLPPVAWDDRGSYRLVRR